MTQSKKELRASERGTAPPPVEESRIKRKSPLVEGDRKGAGTDRAFAGLTQFAGIFILIILAFVAAFLVWNSRGALYQDDEFTIGQFLSYAWPFAYGTVVVALLALIFATPVAVGVALYISHYAPKKASQSLGYVIDLLAAIPSVVYGAWGFVFLAPALTGFYWWLHENFGFIPFFSGEPGLGRNLLTASIVLSVMILPIISSVTREIFVQTPKLHEEAALALGATKWEMIKMAVFPFARAGIVSGVMLGLGRALGETMAVVMVLSGIGFQLDLLSAGNSTIPREIASNFPEQTVGSERWAQLIALGLVLFIITLVVNMAARWIIARNKEFSGAN